MRRLITLLIFALSIGVVNCALAKNVTVTGVGMSVSEAENDALRNAVENTLGVLVDSQTLVDKNVVIQDQIYTQSKGFISEYKVTDKVQYTNGWRVTIDAVIDDSPNSKLMNELTRLGLIENVLRNPKIAVMIPEEHLRYRVPDPAGETAVIKKFIEAGFSNMLDISKERMLYNNPFNLNSDDLHTLASSMQADILIVGQAFSEGAGDVSQYINGVKGRTGVVSCRARVEAKMYIARTGQIIAADGTYGAGVDITEAIAAKKALSDAGDKMGEYLVEQLLNSASGNRQQLEVVVIATDFNKMNELKKALNSVPGVKNVILSGYANGRGVFKVQYSGAPQTLFNFIKDSDECDVELRSVTYNILTLAVK